MVEATNRSGPKRCRPHVTLCTQEADFHKWGVVFPVSLGWCIVLLDCVIKHPVAALCVRLEPQNTWLSRIKIAAFEAATLQQVDSRE